MAAKPTKKTKGRTARARRSTAESGSRENRAPTAVAGELLDMAEAIDLLKTTRATFYRWLRTGKISGMKVGRQWRFERAEIDRFLKGEEPRIQLRTDISPLLDKLRRRTRQLKAREVSLSDATGVQQAVKLMIELALAMEASDFHLEPRLKDALLRYRVDGVLHPGVEIDIRLLGPIVEEFKTVFSLNPREKKLQDGQARIGVGGEEEAVGIFGSFVPAHLGESVAVRLVWRTAAMMGPMTLEGLGLAPRDEEALLRAIGQPWGLVVVNGPTGTGKTTTLYSCLNHLNGPDRKIMTVEDPVEIAFPGMVQVQLDEDAGVTFEAAARAFMRSAPNIIMIGEIRTGEMMETCAAMALTGHLVFTTLHTGDSARALARMIEVGCAPFAVADATRLVVSQRLIRKLCPHCSVEAPLSDDDMVRAVEIARTGGIDFPSLPKHFRKPVGCKECKHMGYRGRIIIAEALEMTPKIREILRREGTVDELHSAAVQEGMTTMAADGLRRAAGGETTIDELTRVLSWASAATPSLLSTPP